MSEVESVSYLSLYLAPRAAKNAVVGFHGDDLKIKIAAPPVDGAANEELLKFLAKTLALPIKNISLTAGHTGRRKIVKINGRTEAEALALLMEKM